MEGDEPFDSTTESLFARSLQITNFITNSSAYDNLKSVGVDLIRDDSLRLEITRYYESGYRLASATQDLFVNQPWSRELQPQMAKHSITAETASESDSGCGWRRGLSIKGLNLTG